MGKRDKRLADAPAASAPVSDPRFARVHRDPRFARAPRKDVQVKVDDRFKKMFSDPNFAGGQQHARVDKYGRPLPKARSEDLKRLYRMEDDEAEKDDDDDEQESDEQEDDDEVDEQPDSEDEANSDVSEDESVEMPPSFIDRARGEGGDESSDTDDDFDDDLDEDDQATFEEDTVLDRVDVPLGDASKRLALVNMDWDNVKAVNLYVLFSSFCPTGGHIKSVRVYPSEFGKERIAHEEQHGPPKEVFGDEEDAAELASADKEEARLAELQRGHNSHINLKRTGEVEDGHMSKLDAARVRKYQLERLRYYYAIIECDSVGTGQHIYQECSNLEFESSGNLIDLRFVPDDVTFDDEPRDEATQMPSRYQPSVFTTKALRHSQPELTWEAEDTERTQVTKRKFNKEELKAMDFQAYLASSSEDEDDDEDEPVDDVAANDEEDAEDVAVLKGKERRKYRSLLEEIAAKEEPEQEMEITFTSGLSTVATELVKQKKKKNREADQTVWEQYLERKKEKRKERRRAKEAATKDAEGSDADRASGDSDEDDDEARLRAEFGDEMVDAARGPGDKKKDKKQKDKSKSTKAADLEEERKRQAALELLMIDTGVAEEESSVATTGKHFNMRDIMKAQRVEGKKLKAKDRERLAEASKDDFKINLKDERFNALYDSHLFAIDPSAPQFKKTKAMASVIEERQRRHQANGNKRAADNLPLPSREEQAPREQSLAHLVESVKRKSAHVAKPLPVGAGKRQKTGK